MEKAEAIKISSLVTPFKTSEQIQQIILTHFPWRLTLNEGLLSFQGKEGQLMFEKPLHEVEEAWWNPPSVLNLRIGNEHYTFAFVSRGFHRTAPWMKLGLFGWLPFFWVSKKFRGWENERQAEVNRWRRVLPEHNAKSR